MTNIQIEKSRQKVLSKEFKKHYFSNIINIINKEKYEWKIIYPEEKNIFSAYDSTPFDKVKVVIIWQDPYHWPWQAHWLCFSVLPWVKQPPSLQNIFKELNSDLWININKAQYWYLQKRAEQWVFMINASLTVRKWEPMSHAKIWREEFTNNTIKILSEQKKWLIFVLWGSFAQAKKSIIDISRHKIIKAPHPSPLSAHRGFFWSKPFSKINNILKSQWEKEINWKL